MVHRLFKHKDILSSLNKLRHYCVIILYLFIALLFSACTSNQKEDTKEQQRRDFMSEPASQYQKLYNPIETSTVPTASVIQEESAKVEEPVKQEPQPIKEIKLSRYYEEGYEKGYDDGEDDAVMDNGWGGQYDDECRYTAKKKKDYQLGYEEGYEAGYYDNRESDE
jgi:flagellar biosynthesis/type III secretory pathway protein FliH